MGVCGDVKMTKVFCDICGREVVYPNVFSMNCFNAHTDRLVLSLKDICKSCLDKIEGVIDDTIKSKEQELGND